MTISTLWIEDIDHSKTKAKSPQTNGICERFHRTIQDEFYAIAFRKKIYRTLDEIQQDVDQWIELKAFDGIKAIILDRLNDSLGRVKDVDIHRVNEEAELSLSELARIYDYSPDYLRNLINRDKIKARKKGKTWYVRVRDLAAYVEELEK